MPILQAMMPNVHTQLLNAGFHISSGSSNKSCRSLIHLLRKLFQLADARCPTTTTKSVASYVATAIQITMDNFHTKFKIKGGPPPPPPPPPLS